MVFAEFPIYVYISNIITHYSPATVHVNVSFIFYYFSDESRDNDNNGNYNMGEPSKVAYNFLYL